MKKLILMLLVVVAAESKAAAYARNDWKVGELVAPGSAAMINGRTITLRNRGIVLSKKEFPRGCYMSFQWKWTKGREAGAYQDVLAIAFHTDGELNKWPHEVLKGLVVRFEAHGKDIQIAYMKEGTDARPQSRKSDVPIERDTWYEVTIVCGREQIAVYFGDDHSKPILRAPMPSDLGEDHLVAIYNREIVAAVVKESILKEVRLEALTASLHRRPCCFVKSRTYLPTFSPRCRACRKSGFLRLRVSPVSRTPILQRLARRRRMR